MPQTNNLEHTIKSSKSFIRKYWVYIVILLVIILISGMVALLVNRQKYPSTEEFPETTVSEDGRSTDAKKQIIEGTVVNVTQVGTRSINPDKPDTSSRGIRFTLKMSSGQEKDVFVEFKNKEVKLAILRICKENGECPEFPKIVSTDYGKVGNLQTMQLGDIVIGDHLKLVNKSFPDIDYQVFVTRYE